MDYYKAYYLMRCDLSISEQKLAISVGHGTDFIHLYGDKDNTQRWVDNQRKKIVLKVKNFAKLCNLSSQLKEDNIKHNFIVDNGITEFDGQTTTGIVVYPIDEETIPNYVRRLQCWRK